jgi:predicted RNase H-like nuclease
MAHTATFVGIDLAWSPRNNTAIAVIKAPEGGKQGILTQWQEKLDSDGEILDFLKQLDLGPPSLVAIDAPLAVPNQNGTRTCDKAVSAVFRSFHAGTHPANRRLLGKYYQGEDIVRGEKLAKSLESEFKLAHQPHLEARTPVFQFFECYPHPALVTLFNLPRILKYKRGSLPELKLALNRFRTFLNKLGEIEYEPSLKIPPEILEREIPAGKARKHYEDLLDAIMCAYIAYYYWWWGEQRCQVFGNIKEGHIITPVYSKLRDYSLSSTS